jgi:acetyltransferase-like isoleucine patch superfamily enzyme
MLRKIYLLLGTFRNQFFTTVMKLFIGELGRNLRVYGKVRFSNPDQITIGHDCKFNEGVYLHGPGGITIGNNVTFSAFSQVYTSGYQISLSGIKNKTHINKPVKIGDNAWICASSIILPGVQITGTNVVISAGAVLSQDVSESNVIYGGVPAKKIGAVEGL